VIQAYTNDESILAREFFTFKCHQPLPVPTDDIDADEFFSRWDSLTTAAFDGLPNFIRDSFEVRALSKLLCNEQFKRTAQKSAERYGGVRRGLLAMMESSLTDIFPVTAKFEFFAFMQYAISPYSHLYTDCDALVIKNGNLLDMLLIGHHQFDLIIFDRGLLDSHAVSFALKMKLPTVVTTEAVPYSDVSQKACIHQNINSVCRPQSIVPHEVRIEVSPILTTTKKDHVYG
jgi:hypothetical protein